MITAELTASFHDFRTAIRESVLYERRYGYYAIYLFLILCGLAVSLYIVAVTGNLYIQLLNAIFLAFVFVQGGMLGHDLTHQQVFRSVERNRWYGVLVWGLLGGVSAEKWFQKHNNHHKYVNHSVKDPDLDIPFVFSDVQRGSASTGWRKSLLRVQHLLFFPLLPFVYGNMILQSYVYLFRRMSMQSVLEVLLITAHFATLLWALFYFLPSWLATLFILIHLGVMGVYMSLVFAPNHKGQEVLGADREVTWMHQITSTRNVRSSHLIFHLFGGLNFQIEHHLFSDMARPNYVKVQQKVREFCKKHSIIYHETTWLGSLKEIYSTLRQQALRQ